MVYKVAKADEYLAITGMMVDTVKITKSAWIWPLQRVTSCNPPPCSTSPLTDSSVNDSASSPRIILFLFWP